MLIVMRLIVHLVLIRILVGEMQFIFAEPGYAARQFDDGVCIIREGWRVEKAMGLFEGIEEERDEQCTWYFILGIMIGSGGD